MKTYLAMMSLPLAAMLAQPAMAQERSQTLDYLREVPAEQQPDVLLDVPKLAVEEITLEVEDVNAQLSLDARVANLVELRAGADVNIGGVKLTIKGVEAQVALVVRLDNVRGIVERTLQTLDENPEIISTLGSTLNTTVGTVGDVATEAVGTVGDLTQGILRSGQVFNLARSGLSLVNETVNSAGNTVRRLRGSDGSVYEVVTDASNKILRSSRVSS